MGRKSTETDAGKRAVLKAYPRCKTVTAATEAAGVDRSNHYRWLQTDPAYAAAFEHAKEEAADSLESEAIARATAGDRKIVLDGGKPVFVWTNAEGEITEAAVRDVDGPNGFAEPLCDESVHRIPLYESRKSDTLLIFLLKSVRPEKYRERYEVKDGGPTDDAIDRLRGMTLEQRRAWIDQRIGGRIGELMRQVQGEAKGEG